MHMKRWFIGSVLLLGALSIILTTSQSSAGKDKKTVAKKIPEIPPREGKSESIKLFNGKDLDGWEGYTDLFSVKEGVIVAKNDKPLKVSTYLFTKRKFSDFRLIFSAKLSKINEMHSGVALWGKKIDPAELEKIEIKQELNAAKEHGEHTYRGHLVMFPSGWGFYDLYRRGGLGVDGGPAKEAGKQHDWNDMEILAQGNRIRLAVNGKLVADWREPNPKLIEAGPIALQLHSNPKAQEVLFKGLELTTFPEEKMTTVK
jgi:hypothetical protein